MPENERRLRFHVHVYCNYIYWHKVYLIFFMNVFFLIRQCVVRHSTGKEGGGVDQGREEAKMLHVHQERK